MATSKVTTTSSALSVAASLSNQAQFVQDKGKTLSSLSLTAGGNVGIGTDKPQSKLDVAGAIRAGTSDIYFTDPDHQHTGIGNAPGFAAIENANNYGCLMILGRTTPNQGRVVGLWDRLNVNGSLIVTGPLTPSVGDSPNAGIQFPRDPAGGAGDEAFIRYFARAGEATTLRIGINNDPDDTISLWQSGADRLTINNGNVGIGTPNPQSKLDVAGAIRAGTSDIYFTDPNHQHTGIGNAPGLAAIENATNYGCLMILGRATPNQGRVVGLWDRLNVNGSLSVSGPLEANGGIKVKLQPPPPGAPLRPVLIDMSTGLLYSAP